ncbi:MAG: anaerobic ribonucleoside-triphosphate reductase activating protein [Clostridiales bacterium]|nr:anaerobic ribonucleoside-triphosphate reductase activating protein [Clostridiales bacterium]
MKIHGFYKLTLLDYPEHIACSIFTGGCNFRCPFCHNASLVTHIDTAMQLNEEEILRVLSTRAGILEGVCITGGEPTLQPDLKEFIAKVKALGYLIKLDTNGSNPKLLKELIDDNYIDYVAMDIKNSREKYEKTIGISNFDLSPIMESIHIIINSGIEHEFRTTVVKELHTLEDFKDIAAMVSGCSHYYLQSFVDSGDLIQAGMTGYSKQEMKTLLEKVRMLIPNVEGRGIE